jgi:23S rRNA pseudouridine1911/1915/1917 synthase
MDSIAIDKKITIIFEDEDVLVIDKPAGITVNKADTTVGEITVQDWAEKKLRIENGKLKVEEEENEDVGEYGDPRKLFRDRGGIVHRLDKETSGILLLAKNPESFIELQRQFKERIVKKTYIALAHGKVVPETGEVRVPVGRLPWNRRQFGVVAGGREAVTRYKVIENGELRVENKKEQLTLVELYPETGRTHQIRVHLKYLGHPIFADFLYAGRKTQRNDRKYLARVFLHAYRISFLHPRTKSEIVLESPLPEELQAVLSLVANDRKT